MTKISRSKINCFLWFYVHFQKAHFSKHWKMYFLCQDLNYWKSIYNFAAALLKKRPESSVLHSLFSGNLQELWIENMQLFSSESNNGNFRQKTLKGNATKQLLNWFMFFYFFTQKSHFSWFRLVSLSSLFF